MILDWNYEERVFNDMNTTNIEYINIYSLFNQYNIELNFKKEVNIYIGENGLGKTTILNCIYYLLEKKFLKLAEIDFKEIMIKFKSENQPHTITIYDLKKYNKNRRTPSRRRYIDDEYIWKLIEETYKDYSSNLLSYNYEETIDLVARKLTRYEDMPLSLAHRFVIDYLNHDSSSNNSFRSGNPEKIKKLISSINENLTQNILYLPTYRRIENDFGKFTAESDKFGDSELLIRFGMSDVQRSIDEILLKIKNDSIDGFNKMTGILLKQYTLGDSDMFSRNNNNLDSNTVSIVINRIGDEIAAEDKDAIIQLVESGKIYDYEYFHLRSLIEKLLSNYSLQKEYDDRLKNFTTTCNKYLVGKQFYYNQSELSLVICLERNGFLSDKQINLMHLSSGEKQIVSLFSKLYLGDNSSNIIIIDEPELSLSLKWQSMLLPDIMRSNNCKLLLTVTHSPFIFENEFDMDAKEIRQYITEV